MSGQNRQCPDTKSIASAFHDASLFGQAELPVNAVSGVLGNAKEKGRIQ